MEIQSLMPWRKKGEDDPFLSLHKAMDSLFRDFERTWPAAPSLWPGNGDGAYFPSVDVSEDEKSVEVTAELPGLEEKDVKVALSNGILTISGEKKEEKEEKKKNYYRSERHYGSFQRSLALPCEVEEEKVEAKFKKGILTVTLPKSEEAKKHTKTIPIRTA